MLLLLREMLDSHYCCHSMLFRQRIDIASDAFRSFRFIFRHFSRCFRFDADIRYAPLAGCFFTRLSPRFLMIFAAPPLLFMPMMLLPPLLPFLMPSLSLMIISF